MRVGFDARAIDTSGIGRYTRDLLLGLAELDVDLVIFCQDGNKELVPEGRRFNLVSSNAEPGSWLAGSAFARTVKSSAVDLLHIPGHLTVVPEDVPTVVTIHDVIPLIYPRSIRSPVGRIRYRRLLEQALTRARLVITVSRISQSCLSAYAAIDPSKVRVIYNGISEHFYPVEDTETLADVRRSYGLPEVFALWLGGFRPEKNLEFLVQAWVRVLEQHPELQLVLAGAQTDEYLKIRREVGRRGLEQSVHFPGFIRESDLAALYSAAKLFVFPSLYEGFGMPPVEAMACGTPSVVSNSSSLPEVTGHAAMMFNPTEHEQLVWCVDRLLRDDDLYETLRREGLKQAEGFSWGKAARETLRVYQQALA